MRVYSFEVLRFGIDAEGNASSVRYISHGMPTEIRKSDVCVTGFSHSRVSGWGRSEDERMD